MTRRARRMTHALALLLLAGTLLDCGKYGRPSRVGAAPARAAAPASAEECEEPEAEATTPPAEAPPATAPVAPEAGAPETP